MINMLAIKVDLVNANMAWIRFLSVHDRGKSAPRIGSSAGAAAGAEEPAQLRRRFAIRRIPLNSALQQAYLPACRAGTKGEY